MLTSSPEDDPSDMAARVSPRNINDFNLKPKIFC
jgi:hypothetical protein